MASPDTLRDLALFALEDWSNWRSAHPMMRSWELRFVLAWLCSAHEADRAPFDAYWRAATESVEPELFYSERRNAERRLAMRAALSDIYRAIGVDEAAARMRFQTEQKRLHDWYREYWKRFARRTPPL